MPESVAVPQATSIISGTCDGYIWRVTYACFRISVRISVLIVVGTHEMIALNCNIENGRNVGFAVSDKELRQDIEDRHDTVIFR